MTWAMYIGRHFHKFCPSADMDRFKAAEEAFFGALPESEKEKYLSRYSHYALERNKKFNRGEALADHEKVRWFRMEKRRKTFPDVMVPTGTLSVTSAFKDVVETLEPGVHDFWLAEIEQPDGAGEDAGWEPIPGGDYWVMQVRQFLTALDVQNSDPKCLYLGNGTAPAKVLGLLDPGAMDIAISRQAVEGAHLWKDPSLIDFDCFFSDALVEEVKRRRLVVPKLHHLKDV